MYDLEDIRPSELEALDKITHDAIEPIRRRAIAELQTAMLAAALRFAAEHPDAPRAVREPVSA